MTKSILLACCVSFIAITAHAQDATRDKLVSLVDARLQQVVGALDALAAEGPVQSGDWEAMKSLLADAQAKGPHGTYWFARPDGSYFTVDKGLVGQTLSDRPYFSVVMGGKNVVGDLVVSRSTGKKAIVIAEPVKVEGRVVGAIGASLFAEEFSAALAEDLKLADGEAFFAVNAEGKAAVHSDAAKVFEDVSADGVETATSPLTGWRVGIQR